MFLMSVSSKSACSLRLISKLSSIVMFDWLALISWVVCMYDLFVPYSMDMMPDLLDISRYCRSNHMYEIVFNGLCCCVKSTYKWENKKCYFNGILSFTGKCADLFAHSITLNDSRRIHLTWFKKIVCEIIDTRKKKTTSNSLGLALQIECELIDVLVEEVDFLVAFGEHLLQLDDFLDHLLLVDIGYVDLAVALAVGGAGRRRRVSTRANRRHSLIGRGRFAADICAALIDAAERYHRAGSRPLMLLLLLLRRGRCRGRVQIIASCACVGWIWCGRWAECVQTGCGAHRRRRVWRGSTEWWVAVVAFVASRVELFLQQVELTREVFDIGRCLLFEREVLVLLVGQLNAQLLYSSLASCQRVANLLARSFILLQLLVQLIFLWFDFEVLFIGKYVSYLKVQMRTCRLRISSSSTSRCSELRASRSLASSLSLSIELADCTWLFMAVRLAVNCSNSDCLAWLCCSSVRNSTSSTLSASIRFFKSSFSPFSL